MTVVLHVNEHYHMYYSSAWVGLPMDLISSEALETLIIGVHTNNQYFNP